jgi:hypothetical protein
MCCQVKDIIAVGRHLFAVRRICVQDNIQFMGLTDTGQSSNVNGNGRSGIYGNGRYHDSGDYYYYYLLNSLPVRIAIATFPLPFTIFI